MCGCFLILFQTLIHTVGHRFEYGTLSGSKKLAKSDYSAPRFRPKTLTVFLCVNQCESVSKRTPRLARTPPPLIEPFGSRSKAQLILDLNEQKKKSPGPQQEPQPGMSQSTITMWKVHPEAAQPRCTPYPRSSVRGQRQRFQRCQSLQRGCGPWQPRAVPQDRYRCR